MTWWETAYPGGPMVGPPFIRPLRDCIIGPRVGKNGYARLRDDTYAHRAAWELEHGPIPEGMHIHHECGNKACINVAHLRLLSPQDHSALNRHCDHDERTTRPDGRTYCRQCVRERRRERYRSDPDFRARQIAAVRKYQEKSR